MLRKLFAGLAALSAITIAVSLNWSCSINVGHQVTPEAVRYGLAPNHAELAAPIAAAAPQFQIVDADGRRVVRDNSRANVRLWHAVRACNRGKDLSNVPQQIGDCVSHGTKHAVDYVQASQIANDGQNAELKESFAPYYYGTSRVLIGKGQLGRSDGSVGAWAAQGTVKYGVLRMDFEGVPAYSGSVARSWGNAGPPQKFVDEASKFRIRQVSPVTSAAEARDAICNWYPVTIASDFGTTDIRPTDGKLVARRNARWPHQMCLDGYDGSSGTAYFHVINSWGEDAHPKPIDDSPAGGFWITEKDCEYITRQGDSWAYSNFDGFLLRDLDFRILGRTARPVHPLTNGGSHANSAAAGRNLRALADRKLAL
jgi:hypothetical protein